MNEARVIRLSWDEWRAGRSAKRAALAAHGLFLFDPVLLRLRPELCPLPGVLGQDRLVEGGGLPGAVFVHLVPRLHRPGGPGGGSAEKPVGLVWFGLASKSGTTTEKKIFPGDREAVRTAAIEYALGLLLAETAMA